MGVKQKMFMFTQVFLYKFKGILGFVNKICLFGARFCVEALVLKLSR